MQQLENCIRVYLHSDLLSLWTQRLSEIRLASAEGLVKVNTFINELLKQKRNILTVFLRWHQVVSCRKNIGEESMGLVIS